MTLIEGLVLVALATGAAIAGAVGYAFGVSHSAFVGVLCAVAGALSIPLGLLILGWFLDGLSWLVHGPMLPSQPCARGCPAQTFAPGGSHRGTFVWCCPCGLSYVLRAPSFGTHEMRYWSAGQERPFLRRRLWWRWRVVEAHRGGPYR